MMPRLLLKRRDAEVLRALALKVRLFALRQIAGHWWHADLANARRRMRRLLDAGLVRRLTVQARPLPSLAGPVASWRPGDPRPDAGRVSYRLQSRWRGVPLRATTAYVATSRAAQLYGGRGDGTLARPSQASHDLGVAAVWLWLAERQPAWAALWRGEDCMAETRRGEKLPDAFLVDSAGRTVMVIEFGGGYDAARVAAFHDDCAARGLPYQIW
jgi:hypothetical protein